MLTSAGVSIGMENYGFTDTDHYSLPYGTKFYGLPLNHLSKS